MDMEGKSWFCPACHQNIDSSGTYSLAYAVGRHIREHENSSRNAAFAEAAKLPPGGVMQSQSRVFGLLPRNVQEPKPAPPSNPWDDATKIDNDYDKTLMYCYRISWSAPAGYPACKP